MTTRYFLVCLFFSALFSCSKKESRDDDLKDLPVSVLQLIDEYKQDCKTCGLAIRLVEWKNELLYEKLPASPVCDGVIIYYDREGKSHIVSPDIYNDYMNRKILKEIWMCNPAG